MKLWLVIVIQEVGKHKIQQTAQVLFRELKVEQIISRQIYSVDYRIAEILSGMRRKRSRNQCYLTLFFGIKRELARTQTALTSRVVVNLTDVLNFKYLY